MGWQNQNTNKKVYTIARPLDYEEELMRSIPENAVITAIEKSTKTVKVTYVIDKTLTIEDILSANKEVLPLPMTRTFTKDTRQTKQIRRYDDVLAVVNIADFHLNRQVFKSHTGEADYDIDTAAKVFMRTIDHACDNLRSCRYKIEKIILNTAGDFLNSDNIAGTTTSGTAQVNDVSWKRAFQYATNLLEYAIKQLSLIAPVQYFYVRGNHDEQVGFYLTSWLNARFMHVNEIQIDDSPNPRQVVHYGKNILIFTHGSEEGSNVIDLPFSEQKAFSKLSDSTHIEVITGHYHSAKVDSNRRVRLERLESACPVLDDWSYGKGFNGSNSEATIMYYDNEYRVQQDSINTKRILRSVIGK